MESLCHKCGKTFCGRSGLSDHERRHHGMAPYKCCGYSFFSRANLTRHRSTVRAKGDNSGLQIQLCQSCNHFFRAKSFHEHTCMKEHGKQPYGDLDSSITETDSTLDEKSSYLKVRHSLTCPRCPTLKFSSSTALRCHTRREHDNVYQCNECHRKFGMSRHLREHMLSHTSACDYKCKKCGTALKYKKSLVRHLQKCNGIIKTRGRKKRSEGELSYPCPECGKIFTTRRLVQQHVYTHGQSDKPCYKCGNTYKHYSALSRHIQNCPF